MQNFIIAIQIISGLCMGFFILARSPKSEGLGSIGGSANQFKGLQSSADEKLESMTWGAAGIFMLASVLIGFHIV